MSLALVSTELLKLRRSRVLAVAIIAPILLVAAVQLMFIGGPPKQKTVPYVFYVQIATQLWAFFMLPLSVTLISVLSAQVEHGAKAWNYVLALPVARWRLYAVKTAIVLVLAALMSVAVYLLLPLGGYLRDFTDKPMAGSFNWSGVAKMMVKVYAGSLLLIAIQLWFALRFRNLVVSMGAGVAGGFISIVSLIGSQMMRGSEANFFRFFPWLIPSETLTNRADLKDVIWVGLYGGIIALVLAVAHLSRREVA